jgi:hypothetical protein
MSTPQNIARRIEPAIKDAISSAAVVFSQQHAPSGSSCALQTRFLENIVAKFRTQGGDHVARSLAHSEDRRENGRGAAVWVSGAGSLTGPELSANQDHGMLTFETAEELTWAGLIAEAGFGAQDEFAFF